uniref:Kazal-like domain-containing protein n=1 Tax=Oncorhynchus tshawytscha TaxID=74940 RepID=A0AAZ3QI06_ONCTS
DAFGKPGLGVLESVYYPTFHSVWSKVCLAVFFSAVDAADQSRLYRRPSCGDMSQSQACPLNYSPVCGNDGNTYPNECSLCVHRLETNADILIVKDGSC